MNDGESAGAYVFVVRREKERQRAFDWEKLFQYAGELFCVTMYAESYPFMVLSYIIHIVVFSFYETFLHRYNLLCCWALKMLRNKKNTKSLVCFPAHRICLSTGFYMSAQPNATSRPYVCVYISISN